MRNMSSLQILDLSQNYISGSLPSNFCPLGEIPLQLCKLDNLHLIDLSHNNLSGHIPYCLRSRNDDWLAPISSVQPEQPVEFTTKNNFYFYQPRILRYFSGIDLSCNNLTGEIPPEIGNLSMIKVLNLSHNKLVGPIPPTFSNLKQIESLDLSYNNLDGKIPQLTQLYSLAVFSVAHNNLSGKTPERVAQFATFEQSSYEGNPFLCGPPLPKSCYNTSPSPPRTSTGEKEDNGFMDLGVFYNPYVQSAGPCGSSSGSGISVAANMAVVSLGTETDGSSYVHPVLIVGIKPTIGLTIELESSQSPLDRIHWVY
ncbi:hypothetical protein GH714_013758 [Hevea brasiliensis]|uniref:Amidase domain-containing protein n=1 Tax=Hevea brasiliensis TaxID=3981 RepID=A0A6A6M9W4_HEVBR|nr:hypothetical protein GH714_013758 [Hevea brasiliensis]